jgi:hypothetical protein
MTVFIVIAVDDPVPRGEPVAEDDGITLRIAGERLERIIVPTAA